MYGRSPVLLVLALAGCAGSEQPLAPSPATLVDASQVQDHEALSGVGPVPLNGVVRAFNRYGAAVRSDPVTTFAVDGASVQVEFDGFGYGSIEVATPGHVQVTGGATAVELYALGAGWPGAGLHPGWVAPPAEPAEAYAVTNGVVVLSGDSLWWAGAGAPTHRILLADGAILGAHPTHVDVDGVLDMVAWTASTVFLLRGRSGGGFGWGAGLQGDGLSPAGADVGDLSGDNLPDLAVAWVQQDGTGVVDVWEGDGLFGFQAAEPRSIAQRPMSLDIADNTDDALQQITVLVDDGTWVRYIRGAELRYMPIGPLIPSIVSIPSDGRLIPAGDIDDDSADEITIAGQRTPGLPRLVWLFDVETDDVECAGGDPDAQCETEYLPLGEEIGAFVNVDDGNGDHLDDVWLLHEDASLFAIAYDPEQAYGSYAKISLGTLPVFGPFDVEDVDGDAQVDLFVATATYWLQWVGEAFGDLELFWQPRVFEWVAVQDALLPTFAMAETDGDPATIELVALAVEGGQTVLRLYQYSTLGVPAITLGTVVVDGSGVTPDDLALCGDDAWVVVAGQVVHVAITGTGAVAEAGRTGSAVTRVDCGAGPSGAEAAVLEGADIRLLSLPGLSEVSTVPSNGASDVAIGDLGGGPEVGTCATQGCTVVRWTYGAAGQAVFARGDASGVTVVDAVGTETAIGGDGKLSVADVDGDGHLDLLAFSPEDGVLTLHRSTGNAMAIAEVFHTERALLGPLSAADGDRDGWPDLWGIDALGALVHSRSPAVDDTTPGDTSDTGQP